MYIVHVHMVQHYRIKKLKINTFWKNNIIASFSKLCEKLTNYTTHTLAQRN